MSTSEHHYAFIMWCIGAFLLLLLALLNPLNWLSINLFSDGEFSWGRRLGEWWERYFPSRDEREQRTRGFDVKLRDDKRDV